MTKLRGSAAGRRAFKLGSERFQAMRKAELKKFKDKHGRKPKTFDEYKALNKRAGVAYRKKY